MTVLEAFQDGEQVLLIDQRGKRHLLTLRKGETFHSDRGWIPHAAIIVPPARSWGRSELLPSAPREERARRALANIHARMGEVTNLAVRFGPVEEGLPEEEPVDRVILDLPEPWRLVAPGRTA